MCVHVCACVVYFFIVLSCIREEGGTDGVKKSQNNLYVNISGGLHILER
jgi:hypothetical protein